jgi:hypothetical protein
MNRFWTAIVAAATGGAAMDGTLPPVVRGFLVSVAIMSALVTLMPEEKGKVGP